MHNFNIIRIKHEGKENKNFKLMRPHGTEEYLFLHFKTPVIFTLCGEVHIISPGNCILLSPGTPHSFYPDGCELVHDWFHFTTDYSIESEIDINTFFKPIDSDFITSSVKKCELENIYKEDGYQEIISSEITCMFIKIKRMLKKNISSPHTNKLNDLRIDIYRHPSHYENTIVMAEKVNLSRSRFSVLYKALFSVSPTEDLINARISKASYLLTVGTYSLEEISTMCGYQNIYHFIRQFKSVIGITPGAYRKNN